MYPAGKTHTMRGDAGEPGIIPQAVQSIFNTIDKVCRTGAHRLHRNIGIPPGMRDRNLVKYVAMFDAVSYVVRIDIDAGPQTPEREFLLRVSYLEIYNEVITDLLNPKSKDLRIRENVYVCGSVFTYPFRH
jgi:hypothetical protein